MKWHIRIVSTIIHLSMFGFCLLCITLLFSLVTSIFTGNIEILNESVGNDYFPKGVNSPSPIVACVFIVLYVLLHAYLIYILLVGSKTIRKFDQGKYFYKNQAIQFQRIGSGLVIFGKLKYLLMIITGLFFYGKFLIFIDALPQFFLFYLLGKILLIISEISKKGEILKEENELTV